MAIYKQGTAALAANGTVTGTGTTWNAPLSLIRVGCTIMFLAPSAQLFTITAINSATSMTVANPTNTVIPNAPYTILLSDSISVDGLAQDVAETLRFFQLQNQDLEDQVDTKLTKGQNLADVPNKTQARANLSALGVGDYGLGYGADKTIDSLQGKSGFFGGGSAIPQIGSGVGFQGSYGDTRRGQFVVSLDNKAYFRFCNSTANDAATHPWNQLLAVGDYGVGAKNPPQLTGAAGNSTTEATGLYSCLTSDNDLGNAWGIGGQAVGIINLGIHHTQSDQFKSQIATSYSSNGRLFMRISNAGAWRAWKEVATTGVGGFVMGNNSGIDSESGQLGFQLKNRAKAVNDPTSAFTIAMPPTENERVFFYQAPIDGSGNAVLSRMPSSTGTLAVQGTSGRDFKHNIVDADPNEALDRVSALRLTNFVYNDDEKNRVRFGFIAEEAEVIAPQYIKRFNEPTHFIKSIDEHGNEYVSEAITRERPCIDNNPIVMDLIGCVQALKAEVEELKKALASK